MQRRLLVESTRLFAQLGHHDDDDVFHIDGVTGPDEYTAAVNDNLFTNLVAQQNLRDAVDACKRRATSPRTGRRRVRGRELAALRGSA